jgi:hypothetical protein
MLDTVVAKVKSWVTPANREVTSPKVAKIAAKALRDPKSLTEEEIKSMAASLLTQTPNKNKE